MITVQDIDSSKKIPVERGCAASKQGGCFCTGRCHDIVGYIIGGKFERSISETYGLNEEKPNPLNNRKI